MILLFWSDGHVHPFQPFAQIVEGINTRFQEQLDVFDELEKICADRKVDGTCFGGDLTHAKNQLLTGYYARLYERYAAFTKDRPDWAAVGNHDQSLRGSPLYSSLKPLERITNVIDKPRIYKLSADVQLLGIPYYEDHRKIRSAVRELAPTMDARYRILLGHAGIDGFTYGGNEYRVPSPLKAKALRPRLFNKILLGHYHQYQVVQGVYAIGSPTQQNFNDEGRTRGCLILDTDKDEIEFIPIRGPKFKTINIHSAKDLLGIDKALKRSYVRCFVFDPKVSIDAVHNALGEAARGFTLDSIDEDDLVSGEAFKVVEVNDEQLLDRILDSMVKSTKRATRIKRLTLKYLLKADANRVMA